MYGDHSLVRTLEVVLVFPRSSFLHTHITYIHTDIHTDIHTHTHCIALLWRDVDFHRSSQQQTSSLTLRTKSKWQVVDVGIYTRAPNKAIMTSTSAPSLACLAFRWVEILEKEFDKSFLALDEALKSYSEDYEDPHQYDASRKALASLGSCFVQSVHKAQTIFQVQ